MVFQTAWCVAVFAALGVAGSAAEKIDLARFKPVANDVPVPIADFFRPVLFLAPEINGAGTHFAARISTGDDRVDLVIYDFEQKKGERVNAGSGRDIANFDWQGDGRIVFSVSEEKRYAFGLFGVEIDRLKRIRPINVGDVVQIVSFPKQQPLHPYVWIHQSIDPAQNGALVQLDTERFVPDEVGSVTLGKPPGSPVLRVIASPSPGDPIGYLPDRAGEPAFAFTAKDGVSRVFRRSEGRWLDCPVDLDVVNALAGGDRPGELLVGGPRQEGRPRALQRLDATTGTLGEILYQDDKYDPEVVRVIRDPADRRLLGFHLERRFPETIWLDDSWRELQLELAAAMPGLAGRILDFDRAMRRLLIVAGSDRQPSGYYRFDRESKKLAFIAPTAPWIDPVRMRPMKGLSFKTRDGVELEGYLTLPAPAAGGALPPLVVLPHGGPWVRDVWGWDPEVQFLASRGYAVFQPNYRGSTGYAWRVPEGDGWEFRKMHNDVTDGVRALIAGRLVDSKRIAIMGSSFGGYLAVCGAAYEPELYRCAITVAGVFDWARVVRSSRNDGVRPARFGLLRRNLGDPKKEQERFDEISPLRQATSIRIPVFVAHGREDTVVDVEQSERLIRELRKNQVPHETRLVRQETHGFHHLENQVALYGDIERFLAQHLAPAKHD